MDEPYDVGRMYMPQHAIYAHATGSTNARPSRTARYAGHMLRDFRWRQAPARRILQELVELLERPCAMSVLRLIEASMRHFTVIGSFC